eukprot:m.10095 g.10095  ORF g.10095 m.10095 type:complete len:316 (+) comp3610_c0_seq1:190-1137(+)
MLEMSSVPWFVVVSLLLAKLVSSQLNFGRVYPCALLGVNNADDCVSRCALVGGDTPKFGDLCTCSFYGRVGTLCSNIYGEQFVARLSAEAPQCTNFLQTIFTNEVFNCVAGGNFESIASAFSVITVNIDFDRGICDNECIPLLHDVIDLTFASDQSEECGAFVESATQNISLFAVVSFTDLVPLNNAVELLCRKSGEGVCGDILPFVLPFLLESGGINPQATIDAGGCSLIASRKFCFTFIAIGLESLGYPGSVLLATLSSTCSREHQISLTVSASQSGSENVFPSLFVTVFSVFLCLLLSSRLFAIGTWNHSLL